MKKIIKSGSEFSGVGAFDYAMERIASEKGFHHQREFACDWDKYARIVYEANHGIPDHYPKDVNDRLIPEESLDIFMTSPPCQTFSKAGNRMGKEDPEGRGILFFNSFEFIKKNQPRFFIFENVEGLLSHDEGRTFQEWINLLGGKSVNGLPLIFRHPDSVPYHIYYKVINAKDLGIPQNRPRIFIIGIRDDQDNDFRWPKEESLHFELADILEKKVDSKYELSEKVMDQILIELDANDELKMKIKSATKKGYEVASEMDSVNYTQPKSKTRRGRVGKKVAQCLTTACTQAVMIGYTRDSKGKIQNRRFKDHAGCIHQQSGGSGNTAQFVYDGYLRRLTPRECFRLMDFPDQFDFSKVSDAQAYKMAGNSIVVKVLENIIRKFNL